MSVCGTTTVVVFLLSVILVDMKRYPERSQRPSRTQLPFHLPVSSRLAHRPQHGPINPNLVSVPIRCFKPGI